MNKNLTIKEAKEIVDFHKDLDRKNFEILFKNYKFNDLEICSNVLLKVFIENEDIQKMSRDFCCEIKQNQRNYTFSKGNEKIVAVKMPEDFLMQIKSELKQCHKNCFNCCFALSDIDNGYVCTGEVSTVKQKQLPGILHSFLEIDDMVLDVTFGFIMEKNLYKKCFNFVEFSKTSVADVKKDIRDGRIEKFKGVNYAEYFMARDEYVKTLNRQKENKKLAD